MQATATQGLHGSWVFCLHLPSGRAGSLTRGRRTPSLSLEAPPLTCRQGNQHAGDASAGRLLHSVYCLLLVVTQLEPPSF